MRPHLALPSSFPIPPKHSATVLPTHPHPLQGLTIIPLPSPGHSSSPSLSHHQTVLFQCSLLMNHKLYEPTWTLEWPLRPQDYPEDQVTGSITRQALKENQLALTATSVINAIAQNRLLSRGSFQCFHSWSPAVVQASPHSSSKLQLTPGI